VRRRGATAVALAGAGALLLAHGLWIPAKAVLAQVLLERAFRSAEGEGAARPWPWADFAPLARLRAPRQGASTIVVSSATGAALAFGPGHVAGTAAPGEPGNVVLAGHRDTHFRFLRELRPGDALELETPRDVRAGYRVTWAGIVHERDTALLGERGADMLTLVTCWPFDAIRPGGPWRYVVVAERDLRNERRLEEAERLVPTHHQVQALDHLAGRTLHEVVERRERDQRAVALVDERRHVAEVAAAHGL
jgi:sortase A